MFGEEFIDTLSIGDSGLTIPQQSFGSAFFADGFGANVDGILGYESRLTDRPLLLLTDNLQGWPCRFDCWFVHVMHDSLARV